MMVSACSSLRLEHSIDIRFIIHETRTSLSCAVRFFLKKSICVLLSADGLLLVCATKRTLVHTYSFLKKGLYMYIYTAGVA